MSAGSGVFSSRSRSGSPIRGMFGLVKCEYPSGSCVRVFEISEKGLDSRALIGKGQGFLTTGEILWKREEVFV